MKKILIFVLLVPLSFTIQGMKKTASVHNNTQSVARMIVARMIEQRIKEQIDARQFQVLKNEIKSWKELLGEETFNQLLIDNHILTNTIAKVEEINEDISSPISKYTIFRMLGDYELIDQLEPEHLLKQKLNQEKSAQFLGEDIKLELCFLHYQKRTFDHAKDIIINDIKQGADLNQKYADGDTVLNYAAIVLQNEALVKLLLDAGADVNIQNDASYTVLMLVAQAQTSQTQEVSANIAKHLLKAGVNRDMEDQWGFTALDWARNYNNSKLIEVLTNRECS